MENGWTFLVTLFILIYYRLNIQADELRRRLGQEFCLESFPFDCLLDRCGMEESSSFRNPERVLRIIFRSDIFPSISPLIYQQLDIIYIYIHIHIHIYIYIFHKLNIYPTEWSTFDFRRGSDQSGQSWLCQNMVDLHLHFWENDVQKPVELFLGMLFHVFHEKVVIFHEKVVESANLPPFFPTYRGQDLL